MRFVLTAVLLCVVAAAHTAELSSGTRHAPVAEVKSRPARSADTSTISAQQWGLSQQEWARFEELMRGPLGVYSPGLDPLTALGVEARTEDERKRFAELQAISEGRRAEKILAYQRAYDAAWQRLFPSLRRMKAAPAPGEKMAATGSRDTSRLLLFVKDNCAVCDEHARKLQATGASLDIYVVGSQQDDSSVRRWASRVGIDPKRVHAESITLNHDAGRWFTLGIGGGLPAVVEGVNGTWQRR